MRITKTLAILAPAALALSACGASESEVEDIEYGTDEAATEEADLPAVSADPRADAAFTGTYEKLGDDGRKVSITLNAADETYTMTDADDVETSGSFNWYDDNRRILIKNGGENMVFAIGDGAIYRMDDADADIDTSLDDAHVWRKAIRL